MHRASTRAGMKTHSFQIIQAPGRQLLDGGWLEVMSFWSNWQRVSRSLFFKVRMTYEAAYAWWTGQAWAQGHIWIMSEICMAFSALHLTWPGPAMVTLKAHHTFTFGLFLFYSPSASMKDTDFWQALRGESPSPSLWIVSLGCARLIIGYWWKGQLRICPQDQKDGVKVPSLHLLWFLPFTKLCAHLGQAISMWP